MPKADEILIEVRPGRIRTALLEAGRLIEMIVEDEKSPSLVGNIYLGRVEKVIGSLNAAFVDLGLERSGFLALAETRPPGTDGGPKDSISKYLCEGDKVVVQVLRDPLENKGPKLTMRLALSARTVVLTPGDPVIRISRRIGDKDARSHLESLLKDVAGTGEGFIVRTAAVGAADQDVTADIAALRETLVKLDSARDTALPPALLQAEPDGVIRALRDLLALHVTRVVIDDTAAYLKAKSFLENHAPDLLGRLHHHKGATPLFEGEDLADDLDRALASQVSLPSGGTVIFSETPALVAIDVNAAGTAKGGREQSALSANMEAAREIARQIRLRNLSGLLVIDFVSMKNKDNGTKLLDALRGGVADDPQQVFVGGFTRFGLVEMTRKRGRPSLAASLGAACPACAGSGAGLSCETIAYKALDRLMVEAGAGALPGLELRTSQGVADALAGSVVGALRALEERLGHKVAISIDPARGDEDFDIVRADILKGRGNG